MTRDAGPVPFLYLTIDYEIEPYLGIGSAILTVSWSLVYEVGFYLIVAFGFLLYQRGVRLPLLYAIAIKVWGNCPDFKRAHLSFWP